MVSTAERVSVARVVVLHPVRWAGEALARTIQDQPPFLVDVIDPSALSEPYGDDPDIVLVIDGGSRDHLLAMMRDARTAFPKAGLVVLGGSDTPAAVIEYIENGARAHIPAHAPTDECLETLRNVIDRKLECAPDVLDLLYSRVNELASQVRSVDHGDLAKLTTREMEVLRLVSQGLSNKEIAGALHLQLSTVKNHVHNVLEKIGAKNRGQAQAIAASRNALPR